MPVQPWASHARSLPPKVSPLRVFFGVVLFLFLFTSTAAGLIFVDVSSAGKKVSVENLLGSDRPEEQKKQSDTFSDRDLNILVIGSDYRSKKEYDEVGQLVTGMRSDTTLLVHISKDRKRVDVVSIPRDLMVHRPKCKLESGKSLPASNSLTQFNLAFSLASAGGSVSSGVACTQRTVEELADLYIDEFVVVDFDGFQDMVTALGGVHMCLDKPMRDSYNVVNLPAGCQTLHGEQALGYARARHGVGDGSDLSRITRQQKLFGALFTQALAKNYVTDAPALYGFLKSGLRSTTMSPEFGSLNVLTGLAMSLSSLDKANIRFYTLPVGNWPVDINRVITTPDAKYLWNGLRADERVSPRIAYQDMQGNRHEAQLETSSGTKPNSVVSNSAKSSGSKSFSPKPTNAVPTSSPDGKSKDTVSNRSSLPSGQATMESESTRDNSAERADSDESGK